MAESGCGVEHPDSVILVNQSRAPRPTLGKADTQPTPDTKSNSDSAHKAARMRAAGAEQSIQSVPTIKFIPVFYHSDPNQSLIRKKTLTV